MENKPKISAWTIAGSIFFVVGLCYFIIVTNDYDVNQISLIDFMIANVFDVIIAVVLMSFGMAIITKRK